VRGIGPQIVEPENVVGVKVREQRGVHHAHFRANELQPQLGRRVDQNVSLRHPQESGAAIALIARIDRRANGAIAADHRYADGGASAEEFEDARSCHAKSTGDNHRLGRPSRGSTVSPSKYPRTKTAASWNFWRRESND